MTLDTLETPAALIDLARMERNIALMQERMNALGVKFRPHVKTTKCIDVVRAQLAAGARGITVSTLKEAEEFFAAGVSRKRNGLARSFAPGSNSTGSNSAKGDFPSETSAITSSVTALKNSVTALPSSPTTAQIATATRDAASVVSSVKSFVDASNSKCS